MAPARGSHGPNDKRGEGADALPWASRLLFESDGRGRVLGCLPPNAVRTNYSQKEGQADMFKRAGDI